MTIIDFRMDVTVPHQICKKCNKIEPTAETVFYSDGEVYLRRHYCEHSDICRNVIDLMTKQEEEK